MNELVGRTKESSLLSEAFKSKNPELIATYGRRRVGKTFLIRQAIARSKLSFIEVTGIKDGSLEAQLALFMKACHQGDSPPLVDSWMQAFEFLNSILSGRKKATVLFLDELPWLATRRSDLLQALDYFWNSHWSRFNKLKLVLCGSAASWMIEKIVNAKGGLHNRLTGSINLKALFCTRRATLWRDGLIVFGFIP